MSRARILGIVVVLGVVASLGLVPVGSAAAAVPGDVVINELMYGPASENDGDEFLELYNKGSAPVDLSGWSFSGITLTFAAGTTIAANGYLVVGKDAARYQSTYGGRADRDLHGLAVQRRRGNHASRRERSRDRHGHATTTSRPWPGTSDEQGASLELIDATLDNSDYLNWAGSTAPSGATPRAANSVARTGLGPRITAVSASPTSPAVNQPVTVTATVTGQTSASVRYRIDFNGRADDRDDQRRRRRLHRGHSRGGRRPLDPVQGGGDQCVTARASSRVWTTPPSIRASSCRAASPARSAMLEWFIADADYNTITASPTADIIAEGSDRVQRHGRRQRDRQHPRRELRRPRRSRTGSSSCRTTTPSTSGWLSRSTSSACRGTGATSRTVGRCCRGTRTNEPA